MGCDIHSMIEVKGAYGWENAGNIDIGRNYTMFSVLGNVRNYNDIPCIGENRLIGKQIECSQEFGNWMRSWGRDAHSASYVTLKELQNFDINQEVYDSSLVTSRDSQGNVTGTCRATAGKHLGPVGKTTIFGLWGADCWTELIEFLKKVKELYNVQSDDAIRFSFFFDN